jgi:peptide/nickel transport system ATP-binding protein
VTEQWLLRLADIAVEYRTHPRRESTRVVDDVTFDVAKGETVGLVGESGSGKSTIGRVILGLTPTVAGRVEFDGRDITHLSRRERRPLAQAIQVIFQDPYSSLNPAMEVRDLLSEPLIAQGVSRADAHRRVRDLLDAVHLPADASRRYPQAFSGGQRQRIAIARSLATNPRVIVCDEPVSGLDLKTQSRVLDLLIELQQRMGVAYVFVSHDLSVIRHISHRVVVLRHGRIVESGTARQVMLSPEHEYVKSLLLASPLSDPDAQRQRREQRLRAERRGRSRALPRPAHGKEGMR